MSLLDKVKGFINSPDDEYYDEDEETTQREPEQDSYVSSRASRSSDVDDDRTQVDFSKKSNKVVNIHATTQLQVVLVKPEHFEDARSVADHLNAKRTIVLNLESTSKEIARRLIDFLSGVAYANNGQIQRVANSTYVITPYNVDFMSDLLDELENNGVFF